MKRVALFSVLVLSVAALTLTACGGGNPAAPDFPEGEAAALVDRSLETGEPCQAPCWYNITPRETNRSDAYDIIIELPFVIEDSVNDGLRSTPFDRIYWDTVPMGVYGEVLFATDSLADAIIYDLEFPYTMSDMIGQFGDPTGVFAINSTQEGNLVIIYWQEAGIAVRNIGQSISEEALVQRIIYFEPGTASDAFIRRARIPNPGTYSEWTGYGTYSQ